MKLGLRLAVLVSLFSLSAAVACGRGAESPSRGLPPSETASPQALSASKLAKAVVQILALDADLSPVWWGSGTVITSDGLILTNAHVVDDRTGEYDALGVAVTIQADQPPELSYLAEIAAVDYALDLTVIRIVSDLDGNPVDGDFSFVALGDSDQVGLGDTVRILGFPGIGGETITFTDGVISGFTGQQGVGGRAWIKTDATVAGGNSGGLAVNEAGELIGVPTISGSGSEVAEAVDCRYVADTNRDGDIDEQDTCVPVGGFINGLRPVALALPLIEAVAAGDVYVSPFPEPEPATVGAFDTSQVLFTNLVFSDGVTENDQPTQVLAALPSGVTQVCAFWDYEGMADGVTWEAVWFFDGELDEAGSVVDETWVGGESGNWWICNSDENGLRDGLYELVLSVEGEDQATEAVFVGGEHPPVDLVVDNQSQDTICYVFISPPGTQNWGQEKLGLDRLIAPGEAVTFTIAAGIHDLLLWDCDQETLVEELGLDTSESRTYTVTD